MECTEKLDPYMKIWYTLLRRVLCLPGVKVNRDKYLKKELFPRCSEEQIKKAIETSPAEAKIPRDVIDKIADSCIKWHTLEATAISTAAGLPGGWWIAGTIPADVGQFYWHILLIVQKLAYLYGWPELFKDENKFDDETLHKITIFIGVMLGVDGASKGLFKLSELFSQQVGKKLPQMPLSKNIIFKIAREIAKWIGIRLSKDKFAQIIARAIPFVGGAISGSFTYISMSNMGYILKNYLRDLPIANLLCRSI